MDANEITQLAQEYLALEAQCLAADTLCKKYHQLTIKINALPQRAQVWDAVYYADTNPDAQPRD